MDLSAYHALLGSRRLALLEELGQADSAAAPFCQDCAEEHASRDPAS